MSADTTTANEFLEAATAAADPRIACNTPRERLAFVLGWLRATHPDFCAALRLIVDGTKEPAS